MPHFLRALPRLKPGGFMMIDLTDWMPREQWPVPLDWPLIHQSRNVLTQPSNWRKPSPILTPNAPTQPSPPKPLLSRSL